MLSGLGHGAGGRINYKNCAVHLRCSSDHIFDEISMARTVDVSIVTDSFRIQHGYCNRNNLLVVTNCSSFCYVSIGLDFGKPESCLSVKDCSGKGGLAMVGVTDGASFT